MVKCVRRTKLLSKYKSRRKSKRYKRLVAYTLIEVMVVVVIIAILASIAVPKYRATLEKVKIQKSLVNMQILGTSAERYYYMTNDWTNDLRDLDLTLVGGVIGAAPVPGRPYGNVATKHFYYILHPDKQGMYAVRSNIDTIYGQYIFSVYFTDNSMDCLIKDINKGLALCKSMGSGDDYYKRKNISLPFGALEKFYFYEIP